MPSSFDLLPLEGADIARAYTARKLLWAQRTRPFEIPDKPLFDERGLDYFLNRVQSSRTYLEYGSGGSTRVAAQHVETLVTVESNRHYLKSVRQVLPANIQQRRELIHADIGWTEEWGVPVFRKLTPRRARRWASYSAAPWSRFEQWALDPDLILVDGRFRVACVLESVGRLRNRRACTILLDDYGPRRHYRTVEAFCDVIAMEGRMAVLCAKEKVDGGELEQRLREARRDFR